MTKTGKILALLGVLLLVLFFSFPTLLLWSVNANEAFQIRQMAHFKVLTDSICSQAETDSAKTIAIADFVSQHCLHPTDNKPFEYKTPEDVLAKRYAYCDQQVWLLKHLWRAQGITGRMVFLRGDDSLSAHTVAEAWVNNHWVMIDPLYNLRFTNPNGSICSIDELIANPIDDALHMVLVLSMGSKKIMPTMGYARLFTKTYPYTVHSDNTINQRQQALQHIINVYATLNLGVLFGRN